MKKAFLFDLDGVLIDSESEYTRIWQEVDQLWPTGVEDFARVIKGTTLYEILGKYFPTQEIRNRVMRYCIDREKKMEFRLCDGVDVLLNKLEHLGIPSVIVTSSDGDKMQRLYQRLLGFRERFAAVIDGDMVSHSKPHPEGYLAAAGAVGCNPEDCVVVEDSLSGIQAGKSAGAFVIAVEGTFTRQALQAQQPEMLLSTLEGLDPTRI